MKRCACGGVLAAQQHGTACGVAAVDEWSVVRGV